jgi:hypothetical protein
MQIIVAKIKTEAGLQFHGGKYICFNGNSSFTLKYLFNIYEKSGEGHGHFDHGTSLRE